MREDPELDKKLIKRGLKDLQRKFLESTSNFTKENEYWPVDAAAEGDAEVGEGGDLLEPLWGLLVVALVELTQLPGVGHQPDGVAEHDDDADVDTDSGHQHVLSANVTLDNCMSHVM